MTNDWQTWTALIVVALTAVIMVYRVFAHKKAGCEGGCGCGSPSPRKPIWRKRNPHFQPPGPAN